MCVGLGGTDDLSGDLASAYWILNGFSKQSHSGYLRAPQ